ncbi:MAG: type II secretion system F family protein [Gammaproteobacteria bacterium]|nr:type II secretion system F family protein [Gammaproteobacteria bacterium]MBU1733255.1 type II secretion system F family protein [Gammaproteobacteria bacterium]MBU1892303.1 type II secretion system F family protein [Gammaproteobacteria bacterium]
MPFFSYKARNARGDLIEGIQEGPDSAAIADMLFNGGMTPVEISVSAKGPGAQGEGLLQRLQQQKITAIDVMLFSRQMYTLLKAGVPIMRALAGLQESTHNNSMKKVLRDMRESLDSGRELSAAMRQHPEVFSPFYISMVRVGEATGMLEEIFLRLFHYIEFEKSTKDKIKAAMRYPTFVVIAMAVAMAIINLFVIPAFAKVYKGFNAELPMMTKILIASSDFTVQYWPLMLMLLAGAFYGFRLYVATPVGRYWWDRLKLRLPVVGSIIEKATLSRFARSYALTSRSGIPIVQGLNVVAQVVDNDFIAKKIDNIREGVERGDSILRTASASGVFTPVVLQMVAVGEETGELDDLMQEIAEMYEREVAYEVDNLSAKIEPILIVGLGVLVLILALGVFLPIWDLGKAALPR